MKKLTAMLLAALMCLAMAACAVVDTAGPGDGLKDTTGAAQDTTEAFVDTTETTADPNAFDADAAAQVIGTWKTTVSFNTADAGLDGVDENFSVPLLITFDVQGSFTIVVDSQSFMDSITKYYVEWVKSSTYEQYAAEGMDQAAADQAIMDSYGMTMDEYAYSTMDSLDASSVIAEVQLDGNYRVAEDKLYITTTDGTEDVVSFTATEESLSLGDSAAPEIWKIVKMKLPVKLSRIGQ